MMQGKINIAARELLHHQCNEWPMAASFYQSLKDVDVRCFQFDGYQVKVQFNPARMASTGAKTDCKSVAARPCFLCSQNRPAEQTGIQLDNYTLLVNPFPIFSEHFTIACNQHIQQEIYPYFSDFLHFAGKMDEYLIFYNGPYFGASAPDHLHFQAGKRNELPLINDYNELKSRKAVLIKSSGNTRLFMLNDYLRTLLVIESESIEEAKQMFGDLYRKLQTEKNKEPGMNLFAIFQQGVYKIYVLPRKSFRPVQYFNTGENQLLVSPAAVEMGGLIITPMKEHFDKIKQEDIIDIYRQVSPGFSTLNL